MLLRLRHMSFGLVASPISRIYAFGVVMHMLKSSATSGPSLTGTWSHASSSAILTTFVVGSSGIQRQNGHLCQSAQNSMNGTSRSRSSTPAFRSFCLCHHHPLWLRTMAPRSRHSMPSLALTMHQSCRCSLLSRFAFCLHHPPSALPHHLHHCVYQSQCRLHHRRTHWT